MKLQEIDKQRYRKHLNRVFGGIAVALLGGSVGISTLLIQTVGTPGGSNFWLNMTGVAIAAVTIFSLLNKYRGHPYMTEVVYIWDLKQVLNRIYRKERKIEEAAQSGDEDALITLNFFYKGSKQLYQLDDNLVTMDELTLKINHHNRMLDEAGLSTDPNLFEIAMLDRLYEKA